MAVNKLKCIGEDEKSIIVGILKDLNLLSVIL